MATKTKAAVGHSHSRITGDVLVSIATITYMGIDFIMPTVLSKKSQISAEDRLSLYCVDCHTTDIRTATPDEVMTLTFHNRCRGHHPVHTNTL
jgi:hypothetical protein